MVPFFKMSIEMATTTATETPGFGTGLMLDPMPISEPATPCLTCDEVMSSPQPLSIINCPPSCILTVSRCILHAVPVAGAAMKTCLTSSAPVEISMLEYMMGFYRHITRNLSTFVAAVMYMDNMQASKTAHFDTLGMHRAFAACMLLALKYVEDEIPRVRHVCDVAGVDVSEMLQLELFCLRSITFDLRLPSNLTAICTAIFNWPTEAIV